MVVKRSLSGDAKTQKTPEMMRKFGEFVHSLSGKYITAEDVGMDTEDMDIVREVTPYVTGISESKGGAGNPSPITAYGVFMGMKAAAQFKYGSDVLEDKVVFVEGVGHVGETLVEYLRQEGAQVIIADINRERLEEVSAKYGATIYEGADMSCRAYGYLRTCALGATINDNSINKLQAKIIAGAANNQLADEAKHGMLSGQRGIVYAPDFFINAGGIINVYAELEGYDRSEIMRKTENIYTTTLQILQRAKESNVTTHIAAVNVAKERIESRIKENSK